MLSAPRYSTLPHDVLAWVLTTVQTARFPRISLQLQTLSPKPSPTSWLDGLRGYAAFFVVLYHLRQAYTGSVHVAFGTTENDRNPLQLPIIRLIFAGQAMVALFFVVSGYSLSWGPSRDLLKGGVSKCLERIRSSLFRRAPRLYLPTLASAFMAMLCRSLGLYEWGHKMDIRGYKAPEPERFSNVFVQLADYLSKSLTFLNVWRGDAHAYYLPSWSIPIEFKCSILLYVGLLAVSKLRLVPRMVGLTFMVLYCHWTQNVFLWLFFIGSALAHINCYVQQGWTDVFPPKDSREKFYVKVGVLLLGLWLVSFPDSSCKFSSTGTEMRAVTHPAFTILGGEAPGYVWIHHLSPSWGEPFWFWWGVGTVMIEWAASSNTSIQYIFSCRPARYLGRISFSMYLVHDIVIYVIGIGLLPTVWNITGMDTMATFELGFFTVVLVIVPVTFLAADLFTTAFDDTSVRFAKWLGKRLTAEDGDTGYQRLPTSSREAAPEMRMQER